MIRVLFVSMVDYRAWSMRQAHARIEGQMPGALDVRVYLAHALNQDEALEAEALAYAGTCDLFFLGAHGSVQTIRCFHPLWEVLRDRVPVYFHSSIPEELSEVVRHSGMPVEAFRQMTAYFSQSDVDNYTQMLRYALSTLFGMDCEYAPPCFSRDRGIYVRGGVLPEPEEAAFRAGMARTKQPVIGVLIHRFCVKTGNTRYINALMEAIEAEGFLPYAVFASFSAGADQDSAASNAMERYYRREDGTAILRSLVVTFGNSLSILAGGHNSVERLAHSVFESWNVPVIQAMAIYRDAESYRRDIRGLDSVSLPMCVYQPEFDGQIISVPIATQEALEDGGERTQFLPLPDRVRSVARMACRYASLSIKPAREKKIAIVLHNMPPRNDTIGSAHGLDSLQSVVDVVDRLRAMGVRVDHPYRDSQELVDLLLAAVTNDHRWVADEQLLKRAVGSVDKARYARWFQAMPEETRAAMIASWGQPVGAPMTWQDRVIIPGLINGHVFIGLQPTRAPEEKEDQLYHSTDSMPPHSYLAYYRWLDEVFGADLIVHVGTHGTLEWLPGKEVGLSEACCGDICIGSIPHFYLYIIGILGEGIQAKRRSYATILDHMIPSTDEADAYGALQDIDEAMDQYHHALLARPVQAREIALQIVDLAEQANLTTDLEMPRERMLEAPELAMERIHQWVCKLKTSMVRDGLHIFGRVPERKQYDQLVRALLRIPNGRVPALNDSILRAQGLDPEWLKDHPGHLFADGQTALTKQSLAVHTARRMVAALSESGYDGKAVETVVGSEGFEGDTGPLREVLRYACQVVTEKLDAVTDEMDALEDGICGGFIKPSRGGSPTRGNVDILPTGRNFYAIDPATIPSRAAMKIGAQLADQAIDAHRREHGTYPESVAIVVYSDAAMRTHGEDIAEVFALMGIRPVYLGDSSRVIGLEAVPPAELGRPRIDAVLRISGLFRDTFPNLIELIERAVLLAATLDESPEANHIKKHVDADREALLREGIAPDEASDRAALRVFGCPPGSYGAGISKAIYSRKWDSYEDLAEIYALWGGNAYSTRYHGQQMTDRFKSCLSKVDIAIKNESSIELDLLDSDDFYAYHGGLIACVQAQSGKKPMGLIGQTADPERPESNSVARELARVVRSRILNPKWLEGLKRHGYKGAQAVSTAIDRIFGWDASTGAVAEWMYTAYAENFLLDEETRAWIERHNRSAVFHMSERLLEAHKRGMWSPDAPVLEEIERIYLAVEGDLEDCFQE